jgi:hypothetical protein
LQPLARTQLAVWQSDVLDRVESKDNKETKQSNNLSGYLKNRIQMRRAAVLSYLSFQRTRMNATPEVLKLAGLNTEAAVLAQNAIDAFGGVSKNELPDEDVALYNDTAMRVNANRWAAMTLPVAESKVLRVVTSAGQPGETCVALLDAKHDAKSPLAKRCTYGLVWNDSQSVDREQNAVALAVQPMAGWRELWVFRKGNSGWDINVLPPATTNPELGYAEFAGWVPGGKQILVAREARGEGKYKHNFEVVNLDSMATERLSSDPAALGPFQRWQDPLWKKYSASVR